MTEETKAKLDGAIEATKHHSWKWLGALVMKPKTDENGETHMAVSSTKLTKLVGLGLAVILFVVMVVLWTTQPEAAGTGVTDPIAASMERAFWGLLGLNGANMVAGAVAYRNGAK